MNKKLKIFFWNSIEFIVTISIGLAVLEVTFFVIDLIQ